jgi:pyruvate,water dikinase
MRPAETVVLDEGDYLKPSAVPAASACSSESKEFGDELSGIGACGGQATGTAALLKDLSESHLLSPGEILVTRQTDPGWGPLFFLASGLVLERGGMLSHGAILAREYGLPCVIAAAGATDRIPNGRMVSVDGDLGVVRICD